METRVPEAANRGTPSSSPQPSSLNHALYLWLSRRPVWLQNIILVGFGICALLLFFAKVVPTVYSMWTYLPKRIPPVQIVLCNRSDVDVVFSTMGNFTIWAAPDVSGQLRLARAQDINAPDGDTIRVPRSGGQVKAVATVSNPRKFYEYYRGGEYPAVLILATDTQRIPLRIAPFSKANLKREWLAEVPSHSSAGQVINVCFEILDSTKGLRRDDTISLIDDLTDEVRRGGSFAWITSAYFDEIKNGSARAVESNVYAKVALAIHDDMNGVQAIRWQVTDTAGKIREKPYACHYDAQRATRIMENILSFVTDAIKQSYPIEGRMRETLGGAQQLENGVYVEIGIGRLAGVREHMTLHVYMGEIAKDTKVGDVEIMGAWTETCEGRLDNWERPVEPGVVTSLLVSSRAPE